LPHDIVNLVRYYFILDTEAGILSLFKSIRQDAPTQQILLCQCLMTLQPENTGINSDLDKKFEVQPLSRESKAIDEQLL